MERKKASDYPQELLDLFHEYQHGDITRRDFLDRAKRFAVGGVTAMAIFESLRPNYAWAEQVKKDDARFLLMEPFYSRQDPDWLTGKTGIQIVLVANSVGGQPEAGDYISMIDHIVKSCVAAVNASGGK